MENKYPTFEMTAKTFQGLEEVLAKELKILGARNIEPARRAVRFKGDTGLLYKANYCLRTALKILVPVAGFQVRNQDELYNRISKIEWKNFMHHDQTFAIETILFSDNFNNSNFVSLKAKDAIVDYFRKNGEKRPNVDTENPDISISIHLVKDSCTVSLDSSGAPLFKRNYRKQAHTAPLNEVLAAGMIFLSGWDWSVPFIDPMCGSGTLPIEAAMIAMNIPSGYWRDQYCFKNWPDFNEKLWLKIKQDADSKISTFCPKIICSDISREAVNIARVNIQNANLQNHIEVMLSPIEDYTPPSVESGIVITNPPYGERIGADDILQLYKSIGDQLKKKYQGYNVWIISSNEEAFKQIGLHHSKTIPLFNGPLECKFKLFSIYQGSRKAKKN